MGFKEITAPTKRAQHDCLRPAGRGFWREQAAAADCKGQVSNAGRPHRRPVGGQFNAFAFDFVLRQKLQGQAINLFILEQLPVIAPSARHPLPAPFTAAMRAAKLIKRPPTNPRWPTFVIPQVLALCVHHPRPGTLCANLGYVDATGQVLPPIAWDEEQRRARLAALDAVFSWLYGLGADDAGPCASRASPSCARRTNAPSAAGARRRRRAGGAGAAGALTKR